MFLFTCACAQRSGDNMQELVLSITVWVPHIKLRSSGLAASIFSTEATLAALD